MSWVVQSPAGGRSTHRRAATCKFPIKSALEPGNKGRYLRLSRLWSLARERAGTLPRHYNEPLTQLLKQHEVEEPFLGQLRDCLLYTS